MPNHSHIITNIMGNHWLITESGLRTIVAIAQQGAEANKLKADFQEALKLSPQRDFAKASSYHDDIATVNVQGPIFPKSNLMTEFSGATSLELSMKDFAAAEADDDISEIILYFDSPGGVVTGIAEAGEVIKNASKPVTAYVTGAAASAAYWLASQADKIVMSPTAVAGSIGVVTSRYKDDDSDMIEFVSSQSPKKRVNPQSEEGATEIVAELDSIAEVFVATVAEGRGVDEKTVLKDFGQGGVKVGQYAVDAGMADSVGTYEELLAELSNKTNEGGTNMPDVKDLTAADIEKGNPELHAALVESGRKPEADKTAELEQKNTALQAELDKEKGASAAMGDRLNKLEKNEAKRDLQTLQTKADNIASAKLKASDIPESFHGKVMGFINKDKHIENGALNEETYSAAVDAEIKEWSANFESTPATTQGFSVTDEDKEDLVAKDVDDTVSRMLGHAGVQEGE